MSAEAPQQQEALTVPPTAAQPWNGEPDKPRIPSVLPILPLRNLVLFPGNVAPLNIGRPESVRLLEESLPASRIVGLVAQRDPDNDRPGPEGIYQVGTAALVLKLVRQSRDIVVLVAHGLDRIRLRRFTQMEPYMKAEVEVLESLPAPAGDQEAEAEFRNLRDSASELVELSPDTPDEMQVALLNIDNPGGLADFMATNLALEVGQRQVLLEELDVRRRVRAVHERVVSQLEIARIQRKLQKDVTSQFTDMQRRAYLREQIRAIQKELGEGELEVGEQVERLRGRLTAARAPAPVLEQAERELRRLAHVPPASAEFAVIVSYVENLADLPWGVLTEDNLDLDRAQQVLDRDHFGLEKVKRRLIEFLAVRRLNPAGHGPILCFVGPPGVGKTSLGQSIADALGRKFSRMSLGGMRDEAEIRGHRRTYIGSMPGRLMQELRRLGTRNPVMMLDEADKIGSDFRGDPASALLEVLDPQQNKAFVDHYLDVPFDLSQVLFIATANVIDPVPPALRDRMEVLEIPGYTDREKLEIARRYLVARQLRENGLRAEQCQWGEPALRQVIEEYTRESGVRELERQIGGVCRAVAARVARGATGATEVTPGLVAEFLGPARYVRETLLRTARPGVVIGLAYTPVGGEVLFIESTRYPGKGQITLTGHIGDVMRESAQAALSLVRTRVDELGIAPDAFKDTDVHIHVPSGAVPKDGPSAGIAMFTALASLFTDTAVRGRVAMTGELTLRGLVLPIGGLKEKTLAAMRAGIEEVIIPRLNAKDLTEVPEEVRGRLRFTLVDTVDEVLAAALEPRPAGELARPEPAKAGPPVPPRRLGAGRNLET